MEKMRYRREFYTGILLVLCLMFLVCFMIFYFAGAELQYKELTKNMLTEDAVIIDIKIDYRRRGNYIQEMEISYTVDGVTYERDLGTDTKFSSEAGRNTNFEVGDVVEIYYNPENPEQIATELTLKTGRRYLAFSVVSLLFFIFVFGLLVFGRKRFLVTKKEYKEEKIKQKAQKTKEKLRYKNTEGIKIRKQYFIWAMFISLCVVVLIVSALFAFGMQDPSKQRIKSAADVFMVVFIVAVFSSPLWISALFNRRFFGKVLCVVNQDGIQYGRKSISFDEITEIRYEVFDGVRLIGVGTDVFINGAPLLMLRRVRKFNHEVKLSLLPKTLARPMFFVLASALIPLILILLL